ncbi:hypothetical protein AB0E12_13755 [Micromonospora chersina]|uniref:hypothetical protein n=1 Tax=Micromonospora chersina TaxID=47854 RepID=UPI0033FE6B6E
MAMIEWQPGIELRSGYDNVRGEAKSVSVTGEIAENTTTGGQAGDSNFLLVQSSSEFNEALSISVEAGGGFGLFSAQGKFGFKQRCKVSSQATFCVIRVRSTDPYQQLVEPKLTADAWELLANRNEKRFRERFGDLFVSGQMTGVEFYGVARIEAISVDRQRDIAADIQAQYGLMASGSVGVKSEVKSSSKEHRLEVLTYQEGGTVQAAIDVTQMLTLAQRALDEGRAGKSYRFAVGLDPYSELKLPNDDASFVKIEAARRTLQRLASHMQALRQNQNDIDFVLAHKEWFELDMGQIPALNEANKAISKELNEIVARAETCSTNFEACEDYSPTYPEVTLPPRKAGAPTTQPMQEPAPVVNPSDEPGSVDYGGCVPG